MTIFQTKNNTKQYFKTRLCLINNTKISANNVTNNVLEQYSKTIPKQYKKMTTILLNNTLNNI